MSALFTPIRLADLALANRIVVSPMSQYSAEDGAATDWHLVHYGGLANSGAGLVMVEATHVNAESRGTPACLGLYTDAQEAALGRVVATCRAQGQSALGLQLNHSGRKASGSVPWAATRGPLSPENGGWGIVAASDIPFGEGFPTPRAASLEDLARIKTGFRDAAERALRIGFDVLEIHGAHGYFLHSFLSPLSNRRTDAYGGSYDNRVRFVIEVVEAVRAVWPQGKPLGMKVSSTDWDDAGWSIEDAVELVKRLKAAGCDYVCMSSGATTATTKVQIGPDYQTRFAKRVKEEVDIVTWAVGLISDPAHAERLVADGWTDIVTLARAFLDDPRWAWHAANRLGATVPRAPQYSRVAPGAWPGAAKPDLAPAADGAPA